jgi:hypothetical protein
MQFWSENLKKRDYLGNKDLDVRILLKDILKKYDMKMWIELFWFMIGEMRQRFL